MAYDLQHEKPIRPITVRNTDDTTIHCVLTLFMIDGATNADMIVINDIAIDTYPAYDEGTPKSFCIVGQPEPRSESGRPRLINARYIIARRSDPILFSYVFFFYYT